MNFIPRHLLFALSLLMILEFNPVYFPHALAGDAKITDFLITNTSKDVLVYFKVDNCFTEKMEEAIFAGIPTTFTFFIELYSERSWWFDKKKAGCEVKHTLKYDSVKKLFYVYTAAGKKEPVQLVDFGRARYLMSDVNGIPVIPLNQLEKNEKYYVRVKAKLDKIRLPLYMEYVLFFVSIWDFDTEWYREEFIY